MVVYYSVGPCKQSIRSMKFTSQMHSFSSIFCTFQFRTLPSRKRTDECYQLNINCHCYCVDFYLFIFICVPIARTTQFTIYQAHNSIVIYVKIQMNQNTQLISTTEEKIITIYRNSFCVNKIKRMYERITCCRMLWRDMYTVQLHTRKRRV